MGLVNKGLRCPHTLSSVQLITFAAKNSCAENRTQGRWVRIANTTSLPYSKDLLNSPQAWSISKIFVSWTKASFSREWTQDRRKRSHCNEMTFVGNDHFLQISFYADFSALEVERAKYFWAWDFYGERRKGQKKTLPKILNNVSLLT